MSLAKFRQYYPQGSLISQLVKIDRGIYIVQASININGVVLATALAGANSVETAEDNAQARAIASLCLDNYPLKHNQQTQSVSSKANAQSVSPPLELPSTHSEPQSHQNPSTEKQPTESLTIKTADISTKAVSSSPDIHPEQPPIINFSEPQADDAAQLTPVNPPLEAAASSAILNPVAPVEKINPPDGNSKFDEPLGINNAPESLLSAPVPVVADPVADVADSETEVINFNEIKQRTDVEIKRLGWTKEQGKEFLMSHYGKRSRLHLTDEQLLEFLHYLEKLPNPIR
ncbi:MAG: hypothetical protein AAFQ80_09760 [Cyanobacteria bacterium J06621_8]